MKKCGGIIKHYRRDSIQVCNLKSEEMWIEYKGKTVKENVNIETMSTSPIIQIDLSDGAKTVHFRQNLQYNFKNIFCIAKSFKDDFIKIWSP